MAEFERTMHDWHRMCKTYTTEDTGCVECPLLEFSFDKRGCDAIYSDFADNANWADLEQIVAEWADEHPEPVYPTWYRWLIMMGAVGSVEDLFSDLQRPIPADIAQQLGIEPIVVNAKRRMKDVVCGGDEYGAE